MQVRVLIQAGLTTVGITVAGAVWASSDMNAERLSDDHEHASARAALSVPTIDASNAAETVYATRMGYSFVPWSSSIMVDTAQLYAARIMRLAQDNPQLGLIACPEGGSVTIRKALVRRPEMASLQHVESGDDDERAEHSERAEDRGANASRDVVILKAFSRGCATRETDDAGWQDVEYGAATIQYRIRDDGEIELVGVRFGTRAGRQFTRLYKDVAAGTTIANLKFAYTVTGHMMAFAGESAAPLQGSYRYRINGSYYDKHIDRDGGGVGRVIGISEFTATAQQLRMTTTYVRDPNNPPELGRVDYVFRSGGVDYDQKTVYSNTPLRLTQSIAVRNLRTSASLDGSYQNWVDGQVALRFPSYMTGCQPGIYNLRTVAPISTAPNVTAHEGAGKVVVNGKDIVTFSSDGTLDVTARNGSHSFTYSYWDALPTYPTYCGIGITVQL